LKIIRRHLEDAEEKGARLLVGGGIQDMYVEPSILVDVDHSMLMMREETFGPLMPIMKVRDEEEALQLINASEYGLGGSVWSSDLEQAQRIAHRMEVPTIAINDVMVQFGVPMLPFGGIKKSGYGRIHGKEGDGVHPLFFAVGNRRCLEICDRDPPANYRLIRALIHLAFGVNPGQRAKPVVELANLQGKQPAQKAAYGLGILSALGAVAGMAFVLNRHKPGRKI
jgi:succinate-semialdehyde dehydrogenase/glutarate-semialdehyde dehydrogenase